MRLDLLRLRIIFLTGKSVSLAVRRLRLRFAKEARALRGRHVARNPRLGLTSGLPGTESEAKTPYPVPSFTLNREPGHISSSLASALDSCSQGDFLGQTLSFLKITFCSCRKPGQLFLKIQTYRLERENVAAVSFSINSFFKVFLHNLVSSVAT